MKVVHTGSFASVFITATMKTILTISINNKNSHRMNFSNGGCLYSE